MKVKVKGLVFVGFAAMIFAANAMAADNTVTSKSYVDNKFQTIENIQTEFTEANKNSTTQYPSMSAVQAKITEVGGTVNNSTISVTQNGADIGSFSTNQSSGSTLAIAGADWNAASDAAGYIANKPTVDSTFDATSNNAATSAAIASYVTNQIQDGSNVGTGTLTVTQNGIDAGTFGANQNTNGSIAIVAPDWNAASGTAGFIANKPTVDSTFDATSTNAATSAAIAGYIDSLPAADIPAMPTTGENACDATHPCALVTDSNGAPVWKRIAQQGD